MSPAQLSQPARRLQRPPTAHVHDSGRPPECSGRGNVARIMVPMPRVLLISGSLPQGSTNSAALRTAVLTSCQTLPHPLSTREWPTWSKWTASGPSIHPKANRRKIIPPSQQRSTALYPVADSLPLRRRETSAGLRVQRGNLRLAFEIAFAQLRVAKSSRPEFCHVVMDRGRGALLSPHLSDRSLLGRPPVRFAPFPVQDEMEECTRGRGGFEPVVEG
jgi:hypothetical protein